MDFGGRKGGGSEGLPLVRFAAKKPVGGGLDRALSVVSNPQVRIFSEADTTRAANKINLNYIDFVCTYSW